MEDLKLFLEARLKSIDLSPPFVSYDSGFNVGMHKAYSRVLEKLKDITKEK